jgi:hypothetical protein
MSFLALASVTPSAHAAALLFQYDRILGADGNLYPIPYINAQTILSPSEMTMGAVHLNTTLNGYTDSSIKGHFMNSLLPIPSYIFTPGLTFTQANNISPTVLGFNTTALFDIFAFTSPTGMSPFPHGEYNAEITHTILPALIPGLFNTPDTTGQFYMGLWLGNTFGGIDGPYGEVIYGNNIYGEVLLVATQPGQHLPAPAPILLLGSSLLGIGIWRRVQA